MLRKSIYILSVVLALLLSACNEPDDKSLYTLDVNFVLPISDSQSAPMSAPSVNTAKRVLGDPGSTETFKLPRYGYIYLVYSDGTTEHVEVLHNGLLDEASWSRGPYSGEYKTYGDSTYFYNHTYHFLLKEEKREWGRVYASMSYEALPLHVKGKTDSYKPTTEAEVQDIVFAASTEALRSSLQDIYSSPAGYLTSDGKYYGTVKNFKYEPGVDHLVSLKINLQLYHVASKVDLKWNVESSIRQDMRVTDMKITHLYDGDCYVFRPTDNSVATDTYTDGYQYQVTHNNIGMQWEGRSYFYTIPYKNSDGKYPIQLELQGNGNTTGSMKTTQYTDPSASAFVPWLRTLIDITQNIEPLYN